MAVQYLPNGATNLTGWVDASGSAGAGPEDDGTYVIPRGNQHITGNMADLTSASGIGYLHTGPNFVGIIGTESVPLAPKYNATTSASKTAPGLVLGGPCECYFAPVTNACGRLRVYTGAVLRVVGSPTLSIVELRPRATVIVYTAGATLTNVLSESGNYEDLVDSSNDHTTFVAKGSTVAKIRRQVATLTAKQTPNGLPVVYTNHADGVTTLVLDGGLIYPIRGSIPTITQHSGGFDLSRVENPLTLGGSAWTRYPEGRPVSVQAGVPVTLGTITDECGGPIEANYGQTSFPGG